MGETGQSGESTIVSKRPTFHFSEETHIFGADGLNNIVRGSSQQLGDYAKLIDVIFSGEERLALQHLGKNAPGAPDVNLNIVLLPSQHDFRGTVVSRRDVARHLRVLDSGEAEIADLQVAVLIDENVAGLEVTVDNAGGMDILEPAL